ncbi:hypothetical protein OU787_32185 [Kitasatospora sp. YST-16]|uniref:hypothetical protein n=1 Tax=Kitasatospora sp. YST-16 TaxID=2998080 RepID=UPI002283BE15|nr:hypothetical protein [Kitasatospora sp. YST-16]WAL75792.1 hypothetical protein OU787_32185 [Kitasatospora sp. YST-16]WNW41860.1 hypothetical protein RKE32_32135 [Streptomyces sp. Li-HN-5-13]
MGQNGTRTDRTDPADPGDPTDPVDPADHGRALTERVIAEVAADPSRQVLEHDRFAGRWVEGPLRPRPELAAFPDGHPLPPSLRAWLAYDSGMLERHGWFGADGGLAPRTLGEIAVEEFGEPWGSCFEPFSGLFGACFLLPGGSDSRRVLSVGPHGERDGLGEYPVFALDVDDLPYAVLMHPGFDVYLAETAGVLPSDGRPGYDSLKHDPRYAARMRAHARGRLKGGYELLCLQ